MASLRVSAALCCAVALILGAVPAAAQEDEGPRVELILLEQPVWHETGDRLALRFRVVNHDDEELPGFIVTVAAHSRVLSRSELHASFDAAPTFQASLIQVEVPETAPVPPGGSLDITVDPALADLQSLAAATESGVYPLTVTLFDESETSVLDSVTTPLIYYPGETELPLNVALLIPINDIPRRGPDGTFPSEEGTWPLDAAVSKGGWLHGLVTALEATTGRQPPVADDRPTRRSRRGRKRQRPRPLPRPEPLHLGIAPVARLMEELNDMRNGYTRSGDEDEEVGGGDPAAERAGALLDRLAELLGTGGVQPVATPYSFPDLPALDDSPMGDHLITQIDEGQTVVDETLGTRPDRRWIFPPGGRLEASTLEMLQRGTDADATATSTLLADDSLEPVTEDPAGGGCPTATLSFTCPISVKTSAGTSRGYALDASIQQRLFEVASGEDVRLAVQRFFAETSAIREETPGQPGRIIAATLPGLWAPRPSISRVILEGLRDAPWIRTVTPKEGLRVTRDHIETRERVIRTSLSPINDLPDPSYFEDLDAARDELEHFTTVGPPASFVQRLTRNILTAESRLWWANDLEDRGREYATESFDEVQREKSKITIDSNDEINLTSRSAPIKVVVFNDAEYPIRVRVHVSSTDLNLQRTVEETVQARGLKQVTFDISAEGSGIFTLLAEVEMPDGADIAGKKITIRSTEFNEIALGLTFGALAFLILFYVTRAVRQRRHPERAEA